MELVEEIMSSMETLVEKSQLPNTAKMGKAVVEKSKAISINIMTKLETGIGDGGTGLPTVTIDWRVGLLHEPRINFANNGLSIAIQADTMIRVNEIRYIDTGIKINKYSKRFTR